LIHFYKRFKDVREQEKSIQNEVKNKSM